MAMSIKKLFATDESRTTVIFACGVVSFLAALAVAWVVLRSWKDIGVMAKATIEVRGM